MRRCGRPTLFEFLPPEGWNDDYTEEEQSKYLAPLVANAQCHFCDSDERFSCRACGGSIRAGYYCKPCEPKGR